MVEPIRTNRQRVLDACLVLVGTDGIRSLTHTRIDTFAELPRGTTSNYFRTRKALIAGFIDYLAAYGAELWRGLEDIHPQSDPEFINFLARMMDRATGEQRLYARSHLVMLSEVQTESARAVLVETRRYFTGWVGRSLAELGVRESDAVALVFARYLTGYLIEQLVFIEEVDIRAEISRMLACFDRV